MSENPISISNLNDFIFCPVSIYFHNLDDEERMITQCPDQLNGTQSHRNSDLATYSSKKNMLQGVSVYCEEYNLCGKIDVFDIESGILTERKKKINTIYDGYVFQVYAQYFALSEMGYAVNEIRLYSMDDNKVYQIDKPENNVVMFEKFKGLLYDINEFSPEGYYQNNITKCEKCIYEPLCSFSLLKGDVKSVYRT